MEEIIYRLLKESIFAGMLAAVLVYLMKVQDRRLREMSLSNFAVSSLLAHLALQFMGHDMTVIGVNPSTDLDKVDDAVKQQILRRYNDMHASITKIEQAIAEASECIRTGRVR